MSVSDIKVLLVSDTTRTINWGGRAASLALQQCLANRFDKVRSIRGEYSTTPIIIDTVLSASLASPLLVRRRRNAILRAYYRFEKAFGMKEDFIELDPAKSAQNILRNRKSGIIQDLYSAVSEADIVVVDGNGDLIFRTQPARIPLFNLAVIELASQLGKEVQYVNSIFADSPVDDRNESFHRFARNTLAKCSRITLRDPASIRLAKSSAPELEVEFVPDSLFLWYDLLQDAFENVPKNGDYLIPFQYERPEHYGRLRFDEPYICISGSSHAAFFQTESVEAYSALAEVVRDRFDMNVYLTPTCRGDRFMYEVAARTSIPIIPAEIPILMAAGIVAGAQVYITGRYHPAIMASLGGAPCVFLGADSHKTTSLQELLEYEKVQTFSALPSPMERTRVCEVAAEQLNAGNELRSRIRAVARRRACEAQKVGDLVCDSTPQ
jgi:hypothetical protein